MSCCGSKRLTAALPSSNISAGAGVAQPRGWKAAPAPAAPAPAVAARSAAPFGAVTIEYLAGAPIRVIGSVTRAEYRFSRAAPLQQVARADAEALLASGYFRRGA